MSAFVGLDVHSEHTYATVLDQGGRVVAQERMLNEHVPRQDRGDVGKLARYAQLYLHHYARTFSLKA